MQQRNPESFKTIKIAQPTTERTEREQQKTSSNFIFGYSSAVGSDRFRGGLCRRDDADKYVLNGIDE